MATKIAERPAAVEAAVLEKLFTVRDIAAALGVSPRTTDRMRAAGKFPRPDVIAGKMPRWRAETVRKWIERQASKN